MKRTERLRRVAILCCHCLRNMAFYRAGWSHARLRVARQFWINANANFIDFAVLEWCKLFADRNGKHHWKRVIVDRATFITGLCAELNMTADEFRDYATGIQHYRDKFVAHLDEERIMHIPKLRIARKSAAFLYDMLRQDVEARDAIPDALQSARQFYETMYRHAHDEYCRGM